MILYTFLITIMFLLSGIDKFKNFNPTVAGFVDKTGLSSNIATWAITGAALLQLVAPLIIMHEMHFKSGKYKKHAKMACFALAVFTVAATLVYHYPPTGRTYYPFISNVTTFGALLLLAEQF